LARFKKGAKAYVLMTLMSYIFLNRAKARIYVSVNSGFKAHFDSYISKPTWANHRNIMNDAGIEVGEYRYWDPSTNGLNLDGMLQDLRVGQFHFITYTSILN
jgi:hypothetical protein